MSHKGTEDKKREGYPFTARQKRRAKSNRVTRKQDRIKISRPTRVRKSAPKRK
jgi:hypothetical protein